MENKLQWNESCSKRAVKIAAMHTWYKLKTTLEELGSQHNDALCNKIERYIIKKK